MVDHPVLSAAATLAPPRPLLRTHGKGRLIAHLFSAAILLIWFAASAVAPPYIVPGPFMVLVRMSQFITDPALGAYLLATLGHIAASMTLALVVGGVLALVAYAVPATRLLIHNRILPFFNAFSSVGWVLLAILWFGLDSTTVIFAVSAILLPFAIINLRVGLESVSEELLEMGASFSRSRLHIFRYIVWPSLFPYLFATVRICFGVSWKVTLTAEMFGGNTGLGYLVNVARTSFDTAQIFAVIILIVACVFCVDWFLFQPVQAKLSKHYKSGEPQHA